MIERAFPVFFRDEPAAVQEDDRGRLRRPPGLPAQGDARVALDLDPPRREALLARHERAAYPKGVKRRGLRGIEEP